ncbi:A-kinase anchor protein 1, mitochondrial [Hyla sarda]|uniref:A-kinase anchor protein 1, mitochondrial n=1 Tax=Hyla sarda TaxID=327740 RepID=UPI0024C2EA1F|nr:A-kinase anchor protein 1, mitochondrial [Hyla sarda]XP_056412322.1 A-kinase anchor protein 1, mitochondrial [Hyla sarda]
MALRLRVILPYTIPGVLALLGWWWFFSRKKDDSHRKHKRVTATTDVQADSVLTELGPSLEIQSNSRAQLVQLDKNASAPQGTCFVPPVAQITTLVDLQFDSKAEDILSKDSDIQNMVFDSLQQSSTECDIELCLVDADKVCTTSTEYLQKNSLEVIQSIQSEQLLMVPSTGDEQPCIDEIETVVKMSVLVQCPQSVASETTMGEKGKSSSQFPRCYQPELEAESQLLKQDQLSPSLELENSELVVEPVTSETAECLSTDHLSNIKSVCTEVMREGNCTDILDAFSQCLEKSEEGNAKTFLGDYEAKIVEQLAINIISKVIVAAKQEILASSTSEISDGSCQVLDEESGEMLLKDAYGQKTTPETSDINVDLHSKSCGAMDSTCDSTQTEQPQVEDIQINAVDNEEDSTQESMNMEQSQEYRGTATLDKAMDFASDMDSSCESTQTEGSLVENLSSISVTSKDSCPQKTDEVQITSSKSTQQTYTIPNLSPVHKKADFLESQATMEDSSVSVCTSEDGISMDDHLQSTALSSVGVGFYDSLSSSGIELSQETFNVSSEKIKKTTVENGVPYSNGEVKTSSLNLKNEGPWTGDGDVDHSVGSDVNSMDSVDSGFALGKTEQVQNVKEKIEVKKAELAIWEIEVPKHLVGRLIGKQGRYVSFLKESSGAKIYISTLPYTQDFQICHIEGSQPQVDRALSLIGKKFKELNLTNIYAPPPSLALHSLPMTSWLMLPDGVTVEVIVVNVVNAGHMFVQQHTHPTFHALRGLDQQMYLCYSQPGVPTLPTPVEVGVICAAPAGDNAWWRAQVVAYYKDSEEVEIRYVDYGGYERVKIEILRQIRSDFVTLPFQGAEVLLDNVIPLAEEDHFSAEADATANEMTRGTALLAQVTNYDAATGLPLVQLWSMMADEVLSINRTLVERGFAQWIESY